MNWLPIPGTLRTFKSWISAQIGIANRVSRTVQKRKKTVQQTDCLMAKAIVEFVNLSTHTLWHLEHCIKHHIHYNEAIMS